MKKYESTYILDNNQPATCPKCGARTEWENIIVLKIASQLHTCLASSCNYKFIGEFETE